MRGLVFTEGRGNQVSEKKGPAPGKAILRVANAAATASMLFMSCAPMAEPANKGTTSAKAANTQQDPPGQVIMLEETVIDATGTNATATAAQAPAQKPKPARQGYDTSTDPFSLEGSDIIQKLGFGPAEDNRTRVQRIFTALRRGGDNGVVVTDMSGKAPRTATEVLALGGDCTELSNLVIAIMKDQGIPGGALVVHFRSDPTILEHMAPYAELDGKKVIIDLQTNMLGKTQKGKYDVALTLTYEQAAFMYHMEYGDYLEDQGRNKEAMSAYARALEIFDDAYVHQNLGILYEKSGDMESAAAHFRKAAELDPRYAKNLKRGSYNEEVQAGQTAFSEKRWTDCVTHFKNALNSGEKLNGEERTAIQYNIDTCAAQQPK